MQTGVGRDPRRIEWKLECRSVDADSVPAFSLLLRFFFFFLGFASVPSAFTLAAEDDLDLPTLGDDCGGGCSVPSGVTTITCARDQDASSFYLEAALRVSW